MNTTRHLASTAAALVAAATFTAGAWAQSSSNQNRQDPSAQRSRQNDHSSQSGQSSNQNSPEGFVLIQDNVVYLMAQEPQNHFLRAIEDLRQNDSKKASAELNIAATYIDGLSADGNQQSQSSSLSNCADQLRSEAKNLQGNGNQSDVQKLSKDFAKANLALADFFQNKADQALKANHQVKAGHALESAANSLQQALAWSSQSPDQNSIKAVQDASLASEHLISPSGQQNGSSNNQNNNQNNGRQNRQTASNSGSSVDPHQASQELASSIQQLQSQVAQGSGGNNHGSSNNSSDHTASNH